MKHNKVYTVYYASGERVTTVRYETDAEVAEREAAALKRITDAAYRRSHTEELICDGGGQIMGRVYSFDLEGSSFYHSECIT